jgi:uncharacterized iron-regulated membrane protein
MPGFRWVVLTHRWIGITIGLVLLVSAATGFLLLIKKRAACIQPPTHVGAAGDPEQYRPLHEVYAAVFALGLPQLRSEADIERVDFRPDKRMHKVHSHRDYVEVQVDAVTLQTHGPSVRRSDWIEQLHDGTLVGGWMHDWVMPLVAVSLLALALTGYALWLWPKWRRLRLRRH